MPLEKLCSTASRATLLRPGLGHLTRGVVEDVLVAKSIERQQCMCVPATSPRPGIVTKTRIARDVGLCRLHRRMNFKCMSLAWCLAKADHAHVVCHSSVNGGQLRGLQPSADAIARVKPCLKSEGRQAILVYSNMLLNPASSVAERSTL
ncbi:hypothetical protein HBI56_003190 [Parastagonospora nodorum]|nr:hypothetical protein HBI03_016700 [Parastagonospora nodorum]KAH4283836.1 hypothetical protein HBI04_003310 [Parastagonospora nodorum]KAH5191721.1 hypothetical protein HBH76_079720 [Parastagonospora nodorum]KAH5302637.1 hypothetical protein HBI50_194860 [Parastagonospora nodorum]KAH6282670.1 hypothetical protein HBI41_012240 [Parastagonospora nodorum]